MRACKPKLIISEKDQKQLEIIARSRMEPAGKIQRAKILLMYARGEKICLSVYRISWRGSGC
jgi:hypothetical protein